MKKHKLHQRLFLFLLAISIVSCSKKNYSTNASSENEAKFEKSIASLGSYIPPQIISISDDIAKSNKDGELYYDNEMGYRYWRSSDGKYYLDSKYATGASPQKQLNNKKAKRLLKRQNKEAEEIYANH